MLTGDFNIDLIKFDLNNNTNEYLNTVIKNGLFPLYCYQQELQAILVH